ncbi:hypothetical protein RN001_014977 [Aquatica leii]|uniref:ADF-H domain-containing protein n=1 Tax=Aquatica leii TaxID=1421715 RepID=A0AAN7P173_9COLE|nr:hypothetical protein RN001_014977 [Aquatica leii]
MLLNTQNSVANWHAYLINKSSTEEVLGYTTLPNFGNNMDFRLSQIKVSSKSEKAIEEIKLNAKHRYLILYLNKNLIEVETIGKTEETFCDLLKKLNPKVFRYILYYYESEELPHLNDQCILIAWVPNTDVPENDVESYGRALMFVKHALQVENVLVVREVDGIDERKLETLMQKCLESLFDKNIVRVPSIGSIPDNKGLGYIYYNRMLQNKNKIALIEGLTGKTITYGVLLERAVSLAISLRKKGVAYGDVITYHGPDQMNCAVVFVATFFLGATICAIDTMFSQEDTTLMLEQVTPKISFVDAELVDKLEKVLAKIDSTAEIIVLGDTDKHTPIFDLIQKTEENDAFKPVEVESYLDTAVIVFTSGSTGVPKPVCHNHDAALHQYISFASLKYCWDRILHFATPHWTVFSKFLGIQILLGKTRIFYPSFFETLWHFTIYNVTTAFFSPVEVLTLCKVGRPDKVDLNELQFTIAGNTVDKNQAKLLRSVFYDADYSFGYGFSEIPNGMTAFKPNCSEDALLKNKKPSSVGRALPGFSFKIVDPKTEEVVGQGQQGEVRVQTSFFLSGYWKGDLLSLWDDFGWMKTGDLGFYDEDRCLYIVGRLKDMFKYQDYHIIPLVIENVIRTHPAVLNAAVIGKPHLIDGHHPLGVAVLKPNHQVTEEELLEYVNEKVHFSHKLRAGIRIVDKLPLSSNGKIRKLALQEMLLNEV